MKKTIEIECPDGYNPVYNARTRKIEMVPENIIDRVKTYEDARKSLGYLVPEAIAHNKSSIALAKLQTICNALNEGHKFDLLTEVVWYPGVRFYRVAPKDVEVIGHFSYQNRKFALAGEAYVGFYSGLSCFCPTTKTGYANSSVGMLACKSERIAQYVSKQFGKLIFDAYFARHFSEEEFEWLD